MKAFFYSIKFRLPGVQYRQSPLSPLLFFFWIKPGTRISVGKISPNHQLQTSSRSLSLIWRTTSTIQHAEEQDGRNIGRDSQTFGLTKPPLTSFVSRFFLLQWWYVQHNPHELPQVLEFKQFSLLTTQTKLNEPCQSPYALNMLRWNLYTLYSLSFTLHLWTKTW